ncbi:uncharacterized protein LOC105196260 isoform X2 [Solenopsis invicta]|uniref:uncharacterized protein LOC105196260 isoform X2 n=1 Tax=Solenopsis invicta TaxID=13686 RepID=UPI00193CE295|nr:uncharacterized protein LOC105196260 isoform X2 [Solenopsis invicta]
MEPLFDLCVKDIDVLLPHMKRQLMSGNMQLWNAEKILKFLKETNEWQRSFVVEKLVKFDVISTMCNVLQTSDEDFIKVVLQCFEIVSVHKEFYENLAATIAIQAMLRLSYCISKSYKDSTLFEKLIQCVSDILVRSQKIDVVFDTSCILQQIVLFVKNLNIEDMQKSKLKFAAVTMLNVVLQKQAAFDENTDADMIIDICHAVIKSMIKMVKYDDDDGMILFAADLLCGTCASSSRFCFMYLMEKDEIESKICEKKDNLELHVYNTIMYTIIPYVKNANLSRLDLNGFYKNFVFCLNYLYQLKNTNKNNLSNHLAANGYLKRFLYLTARVPENLRRSTCLLLSRILSILSKTAFPDTKLANVLHQGLLELPKDPTKWKDDVASVKRDGLALTIVLYYHFLGTQENDVIPLESLITRVMLLPKSKSISVLILKPLWFLFAVTSPSHLHPNEVYQYENAADRLAGILQYSEIGELYTHHIDLLRYCLKCSYISQNLLDRVLNLWLIESDGDIKPLLFSCVKVIRHVLNIILAGHPEVIVDVAVKGLRRLMQIIKDDKQLTDQIADIVWRVLPDFLSSYQSDATMHLETILELANIIRPSTIPLSFVIRTADNITNIILKQNKDSKFNTLVLTQAYISLDASVSCQSFNVLETYIRKSQLLKLLHDYGFSKERSQLSTASIKLLTFIIHCQKKSSAKCTKPLTIEVKHLVDLLKYARKSPFCIIYEMQFIRELLTLNNDGLAIVLRYVKTDNTNVHLLNLYEILNVIHAEKQPLLQDMVYQSLVTLLQFCNTKATILMSYFCTAMSAYELIFNINMQCQSCYEFVVLWLNYRKTHVEDVPWNSGAQYKTPFDEALDKLREYLVFLKNKQMTDAYSNLQRALSQFK